MIIIEQSEYHEGSFSDRHKSFRICKIGQLLWIVSIHDNQTVNNQFYDLHSKDFWQCTDDRCLQERNRMNDVLAKIEPSDDNVLEKKDDQIRLQGMLKNMTYQQYMEAFNNNDKALEELKRFIFIDSKPAVSERTTEELQDYIQILEKSRNLLSVVIAKKVSQLQDIIDEASESEKAEIRKRDKSYVRDKSNDDKPRIAQKSPEAKREEAMLKTMRDMGIKEKKVEEFLIRFRNKEVKSFNEFMMSHKNRAELFD